MRRAKARAYELMMFAFSAIVVVFALAGVDAAVVVSLAGVHLVCVLSVFFFAARFNRQM